MLAHRAHRAVEIGVLFVELVDDDDPRLARAVAQLPGDLRADGQLRVWTDDHDRPFRSPEAAEHLPGEVEESGRVEDVDLETAVLGESDTEVDRDLSSLLLGLEIHGRRLLVCRAQALGRAGREEHGFGQTGLAIVRVAQENYVPNLLGRVIRCQTNPPANRPTRQGARGLSLKR